MPTQCDGPEVHKLLLSEDPEDGLDKRLQEHIIASLWSSPDFVNSSAYFQYFQNECLAWRLSGSAVAIEVVRHVSGIAIPRTRSCKYSIGLEERNADFESSQQTYQDFLNLVEHLKHFHYEKLSSSAVLDFFPKPQSTHEKASPFAQDHGLEGLQLPLRHRFPYCDSVSARNSIFLAVRLWLMLNVTSSNIHPFTPGRTSLEWTDDQSLDDFIDSCFPLSDYTPARLSQWPYSLNVYNLERVGGFVIIWTDHLADHLYLNEDLGHIHIYHHVHVLRGLLRTKPEDRMLPEQLVLETLQTLTLLNPRSNVDCKRWFIKHAESIDAAAGDVEPLRWARLPEKYQYWGQRLETIRLAYDESEPKNLGQWWHDRRSKVQWYTFWVAILVLVLTIIFGLIQSITGVMQVYYAAHAVPSG